MIKKTLKTAALLAGASLVSGCVAMVAGATNSTVTDDAVVEKTAKYFGVAPGAIKVSSVDKGLLATTYQARIGGKFYNCVLYVNEVNCKQPGS